MSPHAGQGGRGCRLVALADGEGRALESASEVLARGGLVALPTDTVYGLACDFSQAAAVERLYDVKGRDRGKPVARLAADVESAREGLEWPRAAEALAGAFWPGALTLVVGGLGVRVPAHGFARELARRMGGRLAATSANRSGGPEPLEAAEVVASLGRDVDLWWTAAARAACPPPSSASPGEEAASRSCARGP